MSDNRKSSKIYIPHTDVKGCNIVGILEQLDADSGDTRGRPIALILHGAIGHKDYVYQKGLARQFPIDSFRFDFRGNHETPGEFIPGAFNSDIVDLGVVVNYLGSRYSYVITTIVAHSRGANVAMRYLCTNEAAADVNCFVNVTGRYRMRIDYERIYPGLTKSFEALGHHDFKTIVAKEPKTIRIYPHEIEDMSNWDTSFVWDEFPHHIHVLTIHGIQDARVPVYDGVLYSRALGNRSPGTHNLCLIEGADHGFTRPGNRETVIDAVLKWYEAVQSGECKTGVWKTGVRPKL